MKRSTYIGLLVLAFAITAAGVGIIYLAFLPASATQAAVETVSYPIEILTDIVKPDSITVDFDGTPAALGVSNYPRIELGATRYTQDEPAYRQGNQFTQRQDVYAVVRSRNISSQERPNEWRVLFDP